MMILGGDIDISKGLADFAKNPVGYSKYLISQNIKKSFSPEGITQAAMLGSVTSGGAGAIPKLAAAGLGAGAGLLGGLFLGGGKQEQEQEQEQEQDIEPEVTQAPAPEIKPVTQPVQITQTGDTTTEQTTITQYDYSQKANIQGSDNLIYQTQTGKTGVSPYSSQPFTPTQTIPTVIEVPSMQYVPVYGYQGQEAEQEAKQEGSMGLMLLLAAGALGAGYLLSRRSK